MRVCEGGEPTPVGSLVGQFWTSETADQTCSPPVSVDVQQRGRKT